MPQHVERLIGKLEGFLLAAQAPDEVMSALYGLLQLAKIKVEDTEAVPLTAYVPPAIRNEIVAEKHAINAALRKRDATPPADAEVQTPPPVAAEDQGAAVRTRLNWEAWQKEKLLAMKAEGASAQKIANALGGGITASKVDAMYCLLRKAERDNRTIGRKPGEPEDTESGESSAVPR